MFIGFHAPGRGGGVYLGVVVAEQGVRRARVCAVRALECSDDGVEEI